MVVGERSQFANIWNEREGLSIHPTDMKRKRKFSEPLYTHKFDNLNKMNQFFESHKLPKLT